MSPTLPVLNVLLFAFTLWFGFYLIARDRRKAVLVYTGLGLVSYAVVIALQSLMLVEREADGLQALNGTLLFAPALCWFGAAFHLLPEAAPLPHWMRIGIALLIPLLLILIYLILRPYYVNPTFGAVVLLGSLFSAIGLGVTVLLLIAIVFVGYRLWHEHRRRLWLVLLTLMLMFTLGVALMFLLPGRIVSFEVALLIVGFDLVLLDICIAFLDAFDEGETLLPDAIYSFVRAAVMALLFGGQVVLAVRGQFTFYLLALLFGVVGAAIASQVFAESLQTLLDRLVFARLPGLRRARAELRTAASALPRAADALDLKSLPDDEFIRLTRRALSHMTDPGKLAASPLMRLPMLDQRVQSEHTLERVGVLKQVLAESIQRLKPPAKGDTGTSDEWRFYNALYFPYVLGIKLLAYNLPDDLTPDTRKVVEWFRANVPERTLYNWQNAAARLVAQDLRDQMR